MCLHSLVKLIAVLTFVTGAAFADTPKEPFRICAEPENLPLSQESSRSGLEIDIAELLAKEIGRPLEIKWVPHRDQSYFRMTIGGGNCDALMGVPVGFERLLTTTPLYRTGFAFVGKTSRGPVPKSFSDPKLKAMKIAVLVTGDGDTPPESALIRHSLAANIRTYSILRPTEALEAVAKDEVNLATIWGPFAGWFATKEGSGLKAELMPEKDGPIGLAFDIAVGVRKGNDKLKAELDSAIQKRREDIDKVLAKWHLPLRVK